jgi:hypothetical protein
MITMTYSQINNQQFLSAVSHLCNAKLPTKVAYQVKKIADEVMRARKTIANEYMETIVKPYSEKNPDGSIKFETDSNGVPDPSMIMISDDKKKDFEIRVDGFGEKELKIDRDKIFLESLSNIDVSATMLSALEPIITEMTVVIGGKDKEG